MRFHSNIEKPDGGRMRMWFHGDGGEIDIYASYTPHDSFYDLVTAVQAVLEFGSCHEVRIYDHPEQQTLRIEKSADRLILTWIQPDEEPVTLRAGFHAGIREIARSIHHLYDELGYDGFVREWHHRPPKERIRELWAEFSSSQ